MNTRARPTQTHIRAQVGGDYFTSLMRKAASVMYQIKEGTQKKPLTHWERTHHPPTRKLINEKSGQLGFLCSPPSKLFSVGSVKIHLRIKEEMRSPYYRTAVQLKRETFNFPKLQSCLIYTLYLVDDLFQTK